MIKEKGENSNELMDDVSHDCPSSGLLKWQFISQIKMKNEKWKMKNEKWKMKNEKWLIDWLILKLFGGAMVEQKKREDFKAIHEIKADTNQKKITQKRLTAILFT